MLAALRFGVIFVALILTSSAAMPEAPNAGIGFGYCATPYPPKCADDAQVFANNARIKACQDEIERYTTNVLSYRACLLGEMTRAILQTNKIIDRFKCGTAARRPC